MRRGVGRWSCARAGAAAKRKRAGKKKGRKIQKNTKKRRNKMPPRESAHAAHAALSAGFVHRSRPIARARFTHRRCARGLIGYAGRRTLLAMPAMHARAFLRRDSRARTRGSGRCFAYSAGAGLAFSMGEGAVSRAAVTASRCRCQRFSARGWKRMIGSRGFHIHIHIRIFKKKLATRATCATWR